MIYNQDCMEAMMEMSDNQFDLAIVDPPYGINAAKRNDWGKKRTKKSAAKQSNYKSKNWDNNVPNKIYFDELFRVSKNQIIWGVNNYPYSNLDGGRIFWDKGVGEKWSMSDGEIAFTSKSRAVRKIKILWNGMLQHDMKNKEIRIHPTQKPVKLYEWLLMNYAKDGDTILDTHLGSGSIAIACHNLGFELTGYEIDKEYFEAAKKRIEQHKQQGRLW
jgi:site-specific DNA-methyltransferase (adenine-specific)